ncbi:hypothetical protein ABE237_00785 [Brevibacillus formosus]|uniref:hypothetical protein n=1 Tax=Brevibacillus formosus TaxID=54913 RepID=UPI0018CCAAE0|nr:hypothetical protein [Brevibacillus formosus]MBG9944684.1 prophage protein [Brevibacillus formosus]
MSKVVVTQYGTPKQILKFPDHYVALAVTVDDTGIVAGPDGRKIVPAGTIIGGGFLADETKKAVAANDATAEGVLFNDTDVTYGPAPGAAIVHGFIDIDKIPTAPAAAAVTALNMIKFIK